MLDLLIDDGGEQAPIVLEAANRVKRNHVLAILGKNLCPRKDERRTTPTMYRRCFPPLSSDNIALVCAHLSSQMVPNVMVMPCKPVAPWNSLSFSTAH